MEGDISFLPDCHQRNDFDCIKALNMHISIYYKELSRVFFKKDSMEKRSRWFLPAVYSFCIQAFVRKGLIQMSHLFAKFDPQILYSSRSYLYIPLRLFVAIFERDELRNSSESNHPYNHERIDIITQRFARNLNKYGRREDRVDRVDWDTLCKYLRDIFEDDGRMLEEDQLDPEV